jgi:hypothetical protein
LYAVEPIPVSWRLSADTGAMREGSKVIRRRIRDALPL